MTKIDTSDNKVTVSTKEGKQFTGKHVIVTASVGVLKSGLIEFSPELPKWKTEALSNFEMAEFNKVFVSWDE